MDEVLTKKRFLEEGKRVFMEKGYQEASLRQICKNLNLTLGAFYGYFKSKEDLFLSIVAEPADALLHFYKETHNTFLSKDAKYQKENLSSEPNHAMNQMILDMFNNYDAFKLVFCKSTGTKYETYLEGFIEVEVESTFHFIKTMKENHYFDADMDETLIKILAGMLFQGVVEIFLHDMSYDYAITYMQKIQQFYTAGWMKLFEG